MDHAAINTGLYLLAVLYVVGNIISWSGAYFVSFLSRLDVSCPLRTKLSTILETVCLSSYRSLPISVGPLPCSQSSKFFPSRCLVKVRIHNYTSASASLSFRTTLRSSRWDFELCCEVRNLICNHVIKLSKVM